MSRECLFYPFLGRHRRENQQTQIRAKMLLWYSARPIKREQFTMINPKELNIITNKQITALKGQKAEKYKFKN